MTEDTTTNAIGGDIVTLVNENPGIVLLDAARFEAFYGRVKEETDKLAPDTSTQKGRDEIRSMAARVTRAKAAIDKARLDLTKEWRDNVTKANAAGNVIKERMEALADEVRKPLTDWEEREKTRVRECRQQIEWFKGATRRDVNETAAQLRSALEYIRTITIDPREYQDMEEEAHEARDAAIAYVENAITVAEQRERDAAELAKLRAEQAERDRIAAQQAEEAAAAERHAAAERAEAERIEQARKDAAAQAEREAAAAAKREQDARDAAHAEELAKERRQREELEAQERARVAEANRVAAEQARREANQRHRTAVKTAAKKAIVKHGVDEETAAKIVLAIIAGEVPNVTLTF